MNQSITNLTKKCPPTGSFNFLNCNECIGVLIVFFIVAVVIIIYGLYLRIMYKDQPTMVKNDLLNQKQFDLPMLENCCSWWPISHFILFSLIGFFFPNCAFIAIVGGILWELLEMFISSLMKQNRQAIRIDTGIEYSENWFAGSTKDIILNIFGFYTGQFVRLTIMPLIIQLQSKWRKP